MPPALSLTTRGILFMLLAVVLFTLMDAAVKGLVMWRPVPQIVWVRFVGQLVIVGAGLYVWHRETVLVRAG
jgi:sterol desaturase/sphingolipid hydroxylase (fatty acid hydroxylase superfamily)